MRIQSIFNFKKLRRASLRKQASKWFYPAVPASATAWVPALASMTGMCNPCRPFPSPHCFWYTAIKTRQGPFTCCWYDDLNLRPRTYMVQGESWLQQTVHCHLNLWYSVDTLHADTVMGIAKSLHHIGNFQKKILKGMNSVSRYWMYWVHTPYHNILLI